MRMSYQSRSVPVGRVRLNDAFWGPYVKLVQDVVIPYQWEALNDRVPGAEPSYAVRNFRIAAGREKGEFGGLVFQDSDAAKWLEAVGYALANRSDPEMERNADALIDLIEEAQRPDGYLNTYFTIKEPDKRWSNLVECHELYCAGHMIEAGVSYYRATGKRKLLDVVCRFADYIDSVFGPEPGKMRGYPGHQEIELALVKLYEATGEERYLKLSRFFIDERGQEPNYFVQEWENRGRTSHWRPGKHPLDLAYHQSQAPVREQKEAVGHAVRAVYMYTAMADLAGQTGDRSLHDACRALWDNIVRKQLYITGGIGSTSIGEAFTFDYDLPNDTVYAETCASIGLIFFANRMLQLEADRTYADVMERALYNNVIGGMSKDGKHYFYVNPLEVWPEASAKNPTRHHVKPVRQPWYGCACCPPNIARLLASLGSYQYTSNADTIYAHLYIGGSASIPLGGDTVELGMESGYPWNGNVRLTVQAAPTEAFGLALRIPSWCGDAAELRVNGEPVDWKPHAEKGYAVIRRAWNAGDTVELALAMDVLPYEAHPRLRANAGKFAVMRGPLVYALEETDNAAPLAAIAVPQPDALKARFAEDLLGGSVIVEGEGVRDDEAEWGNDLYRPSSKSATPVRVTFVPYFLWGNRRPGEMAVWVRKH